MQLFQRLAIHNKKKGPLRPSGGKTITMEQDVKLILANQIAIMECLRRMTPYPGIAEDMEGLIKMSENRRKFLSRNKENQP